jgi:hypothetical protein
MYVLIPSVTTVSPALPIRPRARLSNRRIFPGPSDLANPTLTVAYSHFTNLTPAIMRDGLAPRSMSSPPVRPLRGAFLFRGIILSNLLPVPLAPLRIADVNDRNRPALKVVINLVRTAWHVQFVHAGLISWWRNPRLGFQATDRIDNCARLSTSSRLSLRNARSSPPPIGCTDGVPFLTRRTWSSPAQGRPCPIATRTPPPAAVRAGTQ